jgi:hypothetical protein
MQVFHAQYLRTCRLLRQASCTAVDRCCSAESVCELFLQHVLLCEQIEWQVLVHRLRQSVYWCKE